MMSCCPSVGLRLAKARAFAFCGVKMNNNLSKDIRDMESLSILKRVFLKFFKLIDSILLSECK